MWLATPGWAGCVLVTPGLTGCVLGWTSRAPASLGHALAVPRSGVLLGYYERRSTLGRLEEGRRELGYLVASRRWVRFAGGGTSEGKKKRERERRGVRKRESF